MWTVLIISYLLTSNAFVTSELLIAIYDVHSKFDRQLVSSFSAYAVGSCTVVFARLSGSSSPEGQTDTRYSIKNIVLRI